MPDSNHNFLRLTFDGGRFSGHSVPVEVLPELATMQELILLVARHLYFLENPERKRVPNGFVEAAQLFLASTEDNCITAGLVRPAGNVEHAVYFDRARDLSIAALAASDTPTAFPTDFPQNAVETLALVGRRLVDDEALILRNGTPRTAKVTQRTRAQLARLVHRPLISTEALDGEIEQIDDANNRFWLRRKGEKLEIPFDRTERELVVEALAGRPVARVRVLVQVQASTPRKVLHVEDLEVFDHERAPDVEKIWHRLDELEGMADGWIEGEGRAPTSVAIVRAREVLARLLVDHSWSDRPRLYPIPDGGIQAEWAFGAWACEVVFAADGGVWGEATNTETDEEHELQSFQITSSSVDQLANWLLKMARSETSTHV